MDKDNVAKRREDFFKSLNNITDDYFVFHSVIGCLLASYSHMMGPCGPELGVVP